MKVSKTELRDGAELAAELTISRTGVKIEGSVIDEGITLPEKKSEVEAGDTGTTSGAGVSIRVTDMTVMVSTTEGNTFEETTELDAVRSLAVGLTKVSSVGAAILETADEL